MSTLAEELGSSCAASGSSLATAAWVRSPLVERRIYKVAEERVRRVDGWLRRLPRSLKNNSRRIGIDRWVPEGDGLKGVGDGCTPKAAPKKKKNLRCKATSKNVNAKSPSLEGRALSPRGPYSYSLFHLLLIGFWVLLTYIASCLVFENPIGGSIFFQNYSQ